MTMQIDPDAKPMVMDAKPVGGVKLVEYSFDAMLAETSQRVADAYAQCLPGIGMERGDLHAILCKLSEYKERMDGAVDRFLAWPLPPDFSPDGGITFTPPDNPNAWPIGTNLMTATQAKKMFDAVLMDEQFKQASGERAAHTATSLVQNFKRDAADMAQLDAAIERYIEDYVQEGDEGHHTPTEGERFMLKDAVHGLLDDYEVWERLMRVLAPTRFDPVLNKPQVRMDIDQWRDEALRLRQKIKDESDEHRRRADAVTRLATENQKMREAMDEVLDMLDNGTVIEDFLVRELFNRAMGR